MLIYKKPLTNAMVALLSVFTTWQIIASFNSKPSKPFPGTTPSPNEPAPTPEPTPLPDDPSSKNVVKVLAFGDSGTGEAKQFSVGRSMKRVCDKEGCDLAIMLGDNFYANGVGHVDDQQFIDKFEKPYEHLNFNFYSSLGNHDDRGDTQAQVEYTEKSQKWKMFSKYYSFRKGNVLFVAIDSNDFDRRQEEWVKTTLQNSDAKWKVVYGHHPIYSYGLHGNTGHLIDHLLPIMCEYGSLYVAGHDHNLQVLQAPCGMPTIISGAAAKLRSASYGSKSLFAASAYGYARIEFGEDSYKVIMYKEDDSVLYENYFSNNNDSANESVYKPLSSETHITTCNREETIVGFKYKTKGDDHIQGIYCRKNFPGESSQQNTDVINVADQFGWDYDVNCPGQDQALVGVEFTDGQNDKFLNKMHCLEQPDPAFVERRSRFIPIVENGNDILDVFCTNPKEAVVGLNYDDFGDHHIEGIFCK